MKFKIYTITLLLLIISNSAVAKCNFTARAKDEIRNVQLSDREKYLDRENPIKFSYWVDSVKATDQSIVVAFKATATLKEMETNKEKDVKFRVDPGGDRAASVILSPLFIFSPSAFFQNMIGCEDEISSSKETLNLKNAQPTGAETVVEDYFPSSSIDLVIDANGKKLFHSGKISNGEIFISLTTAYGDNGFDSFMKEVGKSKASDITVICNQCKGSDPDLQHSTSITARVDFSEINNSYLSYLAQIKKNESDEKKAQYQKQQQSIADRKKAEDTKLKIEADRKKAIEDKEKKNSEASLKDQEVKSKQFDGAKAKCENLGFTKGTEAFGKCVLEISK
jgi:hypothetical protein